MPKKTRKPSSKTGKKILFIFYALISLFLFAGSPTRRQSFTHIRMPRDTTNGSDFKIIVLTMNRLESLSALLKSIEETDFGSDKVQLQVRFDKAENQEEIIKFARAFKFSHGSKEIFVSNRSLGLARSWYDAWRPIDNSQRAIILEDDITLSQAWYKWMKMAWLKYGNRTDLAGISLQRQVLVPKEPWRDDFRPEGAEPFLYALVGSIGFSPNPRFWRQFTEWINMISVDTFDASTPGLITSQWWNTHDKRQMWTQNFIHFTSRSELYTLYIHLPRNKTLAAHMRAAGAHIKKNMGADFPLAKEVKLNFPNYLVKYDWDGENVVNGRQASKAVVFETLLHTALAINSSHGFVYLLFLNSGFLEMTKNWVCTILRSARDVLPHTIFISSDIETTRKLVQFRHDLQIFTIASERVHAVAFGSFDYYNVVLERMKLQNELLLKGVNIQVIESDQFWAEDISSKLRELFRKHEIFGGQEGKFPKPDPDHLCGGFYGIASTQITRPFFNKYVSSYAKRLELRHGEAGMKNLADYEDDQRTLTRLASEANIQIKYLDRCEYANGLWFKQKDFSDTCPNPSVIHNGYIVGNDAKIARARETSRWFLSADGEQCT